MIEGITVLNEIAVTGVPSWMMISAIIISIIGFIVFAIAIIAEWPAWKAIIPIIIVLFTWFICGIFNITFKTGKYQYECIIDDSVPYNEVIENYNIIEQRGDIWVLEDK